MQLLRVDAISSVHLTISGTRALNFWFDSYDRINKFWQFSTPLENIERWKHSLYSKKIDLIRRVMYQTFQRVTVVTLFITITYTFIHNNKTVILLLVPIFIILGCVCFTTESAMNSGNVYNIRYNICCKFNSCNNCTAVFHNNDNLYRSLAVNSQQIQRYQLPSDTIFYYILLLGCQIEILE